MQRLPCRRLRGKQGGASLLPTLAFLLGFLDKLIEFLTQALPALLGSRALLLERFRFRNERPVEQAAPESRRPEIGRASLQDSRLELGDLCRELVVSFWLRIEGILRPCGLWRTQRRRRGNPL